MKIRINGITFNKELGSFAENIELDEDTGLKKLLLYLFFKTSDDSVESFGNEIKQLINANIELIEVLENDKVITSFDYYNSIRTVSHSWEEGYPHIMQLVIE